MLMYMIALDLANYCDVDAIFQFLVYFFGRKDCRLATELLLRK